MFDIDKLKKRIKITDDKIECPVKDCTKKVNIMNRGGQRKIDSNLGKNEDNLLQFKKFLCNTHQIYISPSSIIYKKIKDNSLWNEKVDTALLDNIMEVKRYPFQLYHHNGEDAVCWNVFRYLEKNNIVNDFLERTFSVQNNNYEIIYWSYSQKSGPKWTELEKARNWFGERIQRSSEPDIIIKTDKNLYIFEAKVGASNKDSKRYKGKEKDERVKRYGKANHFLKKPFEDIMEDGFYQLGRNWQIGNWIAEQQNPHLDFYLINLVRENEDKEIEKEFGNYIYYNQNRNFRRITWEKDFYQYILHFAPNNKDKTTILNYIKKKTLGYKKGEIQKAFSI